MRVLLAVLMICFLSTVQAQKKEDTYVQKGDLVEATLYHENGQIEQHGFFKNKKLHGTWTYFNTKGEKVSIGNYDNGVKTGKWIFYMEDTQREVDYDNGRIINVVETARES